MRTFSTAVQALIESEETKGPWFAIDFQLSTDSTYSFCNADVDIPYGGKRYVPRGFEVTEISQSANFSNDIATIEFDNADREMSAIVLNQDVANKTVLANIVYHTTAGFIGAELFHGVITKWDLDESKVTFKLGSEFMLWHKKSLRLPTPNCPWSFKSTECAYTGDSTWCDKTADWCTELGNFPRFGGRRYISDIENKKIYWSNK